MTARISVKKSGAFDKKNNEFVVEIRRIVDNCGLLQVTISERMDYDNPNIISMFKSGTMRVPVDRVAMLANAVGADPAALLHLWFTTYSPELLTSIDEFSMMLGNNEKAWITGLRKHFGSEVPSFDRCLLA